MSESTNAPRPIQAPADAQTQTGHAAHPTYRFEQLSDNGNSITILLGDVSYVLRKTQAGKLILNK